MPTSTRTSRASNSRAADEANLVRDIAELEGMDFSPANLDTRNLPAREGYVQRWVRTKIGNEDDASNVFRNSNLGWKPRMADSVNKGSLVPTVELNGENIIGLHDTILMERPKVIDDKHKAYERSLARNQMQSVDNDMLKVHDRNSGMGAPVSNSKSSVSKGRVAPITPD